MPHHLLIPLEYQNHLKTVRKNQVFPIRYLILVNTHCERSFDERRVQLAFYPFIAPTTMGRTLIAYHRLNLGVQSTWAITIRNITIIWF